ncbi:hypothetical protein B484DRAFT_390924 [Ochromonadaceae sp. CCMP2298]|nr:hypothetical protein B484DRAFT_390924 [Ochromonadaceae sp. CCMP2298]
MSDQRALLRRLFVVLQQQFELHRLGAKEEESSDARSYPSNPANPANPVDPSSGGIPAAAVVPLFSTLQFHVDRSVWHYEWGATVTLDEYVSSYPRSACSVTADGKTLLDLVRGGKVMAAFITGRLSVKGDTAVFKRSGGVLRRAFAALRGEMDREKAEAEAQGGQGLGQGVQGRGRGITVVITEAVARSFVYSPMKGGNGNGNGGGNGGGNGNGGGGGDTNGELRVSMGGRGESATRYRVEVTDSEGRTWHVVHRYSSFVALRRELRLLSPARLPTLSQRPYLFPGLSLAQSRAALLDTFIKQCVELDSEALSVFLDLDRRHGPAEGSLSQASNGGYSASARSETSPAPFSASASTPASASYASSASASASVSAWAGGATARNRAFQEQRREAHMHATSTPISWNSAQLGQGRFLVQELQQLNKMAERDGGGGGDKLGRVLSLLGEGALVAVLGVLAYHFMEHDYSYPFTDLLSPLSPSPPSPLSPLSLSPSLLAPSLLSLRLCAVCRLTTVLLLATTPTRRRRTVLCFLLWVVVIHGAGEGLAGLGRVLVVYWEGVETAVGIASADFVCASAASAAAAASTAANASAASASAVALWRTLPFLRLIPGIGAGVGASVGAGWGGVGAGICAAPTPTPTLLPLLLASLPSVLWAMLPFQRLLIVLLNLLLSLLPQSADLEVGVGALALLCAILGVTLSSPGVARAARIYSLGVGLISLYAGLQLVCRIARLDTATQGALFSSVDQIVAPFMASQISHLRSVFVKFGQYFGARSDLVGPAWTGTFKSLQDCCPPDSAAYVRATVERALAECLAAGEGAGAGAVGGSNTSAGVGTGVGAGVAGGGTVGGTGAPTLEDFFDSFDLSPLASASIAQVHTATLKAGAMERLRPRQAQGQGQGLFNGDSGDSGDRNGGGGVHTRTNPHTPSTHTHAHNEHTHGPTELDRLLVFSAAATDPEFVAGTAARAGGGGMGGMGGMGDMGGMSGGMGMGGGMGGGMGMGEQSPLPPLPPLPCPLRVVVKVQHEGVSPLMRADMRIVLLLVTWAARLDDRWQAMVSVLQSWERTMQDELDFHQEAANLR